MLLRSPHVRRTCACARSVSMLFASVCGVQKTKFWQLSTASQADPRRGRPRYGVFSSGALQPSPSPHRRNCTALLRAGLDWTYCTSGFVQQRHGDGCIEIRLHECIALGLALPSQSWSSLGERHDKRGVRESVSSMPLRPRYNLHALRDWGGKGMDGWLGGWMVGGWTVDGFLVRRDKLDTDCSADRYFHLLHRLCQK